MPRTRGSSIGPAGGSGGGAVDECGKRKSRSEYLCPDQKAKLQVGENVQVKYESPSGWCDGKVTEVTVVGKTWSCIVKANSDGDPQEFTPPNLDLRVLRPTTNSAPEGRKLRGSQEGGSAKSTPNPRTAALSPATAGRKLRGSQDGGSASSASRSAGGAGGYQDRHRASAADSLDGYTTGKAQKDAWVAAASVLESLKSNIEADGGDLVIGLDLGHSGTAVATAWKGPEGAKNMMIFSPGLPGELTSTKECTCLLLDKETELIACGDNAKKMAHEKSAEDPVGFRTKYMFFEGFKMALNKMKSNDPTPMVKATIGLQTPVSVQLLVQRMIEKTDKEVSNRIAKNSTSKRIRSKTWVLTVPSIWGLPARRVVELAACNAGLNSQPTEAMFEEARRQGHHPPVKCTLLFPSEPEAAALQIGHSISDIVMVIDNGGGTTDITTIEIVANKRETRQSKPTQRYFFKEIQQPTGGACGSKWIDQNLIQEVLEKIFLVEEYLKIPAALKAQFIQNFQQIKHDYGNNDGYHITTIPIGDICASINESPSQPWSRVITERIKDLDMKLIPPSTLKLGSALIAELFEPVILEITGMIEQELKTSVNNGQVPHRVICVGGFSDSQALYNRIQETIRNLFSNRPQYKIEVILGKDPRLAVLKGGVMWGLQHGQFDMLRLARKTYLYDEDVLLQDFEKLHPGHLVPEDKKSKCGKKDYASNVATVILLPPPLYEQSLGLI
mmetsp:Transcript_5154/g.8274  ORF Transcript_5154/g.8274 Transcript_5154/m.8274 type:complete len:728 (+) Transcript_5154:34-2217(+)